MVYLILLFQQLIASSTHLIAKSVTDAVDPFMVLLLRGGFSSLAYIPLIIVARKRFKDFTSQDIWQAVILSLINIPINQLLFLNGLERSAAPNGALMYSLTPVFVVILSSIFLKEKVTLAKVLGIVIAVAGTVIILLEKGLDFRSDYFVGNILLFFAGFSWAVYTTVGKSFSTKHGAGFATGISMIGGTALYIPLFSIIPVSTVVSEIPLVNWGQIAYLGVITSGVSYALWSYALTKIDASNVAVFNNIQPVLTTFLTFLIFGDVPTTTFVVGGIIALCGVILTQAQSFRKKTVQSS